MRSRLDQDSESFIDALRGLAAWGVLVTHAVDIGIMDVYGGELALTPVPWRWARATMGCGGFLVWCFFVISGLCIHQSIARSVASGTFSWWRYTVARVSRIYPLFLLGLLLAVVVWWFTDPPGGVSLWPQFLASLASLQVLTNNFPNFGPSWSLSNEMIYYFVWPMALLWLARGDAGRAFRLCLVGAFLAAAGIMLVWKVSPGCEHSALVNGLWTITVLFPLWASGAWLGSVWKTAQEKISARVWLLSVPLCIASWLLLVVLRFVDGPAWVSRLAGLTSVPGLLLLVAGAHHARLASRGWMKELSRWLGQFSYPCYVLHMQFLILEDRVLMPKLGHAVAGNAVLHSLALIVPVSLLLAAVGPWMERGVMRWRAGLLAAIPTTEGILKEG